MYESFFGLSREPFSVAPDPRFIYLSPSHREAVAHLMYGLRRGAGFLLMTGEIGAGKTTVWRAFLEHIPSNVDVAFVVNPKLDARALLGRVCEDLRVDVPPGTQDLIDAIHGHLLLASAKGRRTLIAIDEAQVLSLDVLEQLRLLTNLDSTGGRMQVLLIGQPELRAMLRQPVLEPVEQRVVARFHLPALAAEETARYIMHRLSVAGLVGEIPFDDGAMRLVHELCKGVPRRINVVCDRAMSLAHIAGSRRVSDDIIRQAAIDVLGESPRSEPDAASAPTAVAEAPVGAGVSGPQASRLWPVPAGVAAALVVAGLLAGLSIGHRSASVETPALAPPAGETRPAPGTATAGGIAPNATLASAAAALSGGATPTANTGPAVPSLPTTVPERVRAVAQAGSIDALVATGAADEPSSVRALATLWDVILPPSDPCAVSQINGLSCYRTTGGLGPIRELGRPGVVRLVAESGRTTFALLVGLTDTTATFRTADGDKQVLLADVARHWRGDFVTLWRPPAGYTPNELINASDPLAPWLAERLAVIDGTPSIPLSGAALTARIYSFQVAHGLKPDGVAGPLTLMQLSRASGASEPRLATS
jgi:general secretion pathway protein A